MRLAPSAGTTAVLLAVIDEAIRGWAVMTGGRPVASGVIKLLAKLNSLESVWRMRGPV